MELRRLTELPLAFQPGEGWRYHHSFGVLGILISRVTGRPLGKHLAEDVFGPLGMTDTALWVAEGEASGSRRLTGTVMAKSLVTVPVSRHQPAQLSPPPPSSAVWVIPSGPKTSSARCLPVRRPVTREMRMPSTPNEW